MTTDERHHYWQTQINNWQQSGKSQRQFCTDNQLSYSTFCYWRTKFSQTNKPDRKWLPVKVTAASSVSVILPSGIRIETSAETLLALLPGFYRTLKEVEGC